MRKIEVLMNAVADKIAAGEVVERPSSALKELIENSIDAGSTAISIEFTGGGLEYMRVCDNGCGIPHSEVETAFLRHATSKVATSEDLNAIITLGFRGEALPSIASISQLTMKTRVKNSNWGTILQINGGETVTLEPCGCPEGTSVTVENLFYNVPARRAFVKSIRTETNRIVDLISRLILSHPEISFKLTGNNRLICKSLGDGILRNAVYGVFGADIMPHLRDLKFDDGYLKIDGLVGDETIATANKQRQSIYVNGRYIKSRNLTYSTVRAFDQRIMRGSFPFLTANFIIAPEEINVNVHPNKMEVRFKNEERVTFALVSAIKEALGGYTIPEILSHKDENLPYFKKQSYEPPRSRNLLGNERPYVSTYTQAVNLQDSGSLPYNFEKIGAFCSEKADGKKNIELTSSKGRRSNLEQSVLIRIPDVENPYKIIGSAFNTYWFIEQEGELLILDQHAAHERLLYEKYTSEDAESLTQTFLIPLTIHLTPMEYDVFQENQAAFKELGFLIDQFGEQTISLRGIPNILGKTDAEAVLRETLEKIKDNKKLTTVELKRDAVIKAACKHAVKGGSIVDIEAVKKIIAEFNTGTVPLTCPHGRPIIVKFTKNEIEKFFKRIV
ncbi:MAG: DNA mismatch repair endonuclease MutL [Clostridia bacterium]